MQINTSAFLALIGHAEPNVLSAITWNPYPLTDPFYILPVSKHALFVSLD